MTGKFGEHEHRMLEGRQRLDDLLRSMIELVDLRRKIPSEFTEIRNTMLDLFVSLTEARSETAVELHKLKRELGLSVGDSEREAIVVEDAANFARASDIPYLIGRDIAEFAMRSAMSGSDPRWPKALSQTALRDEAAILIFKIELRGDEA